MDFSKLNQWLSLLANIGVLVGLLVVIVELRQTQDSIAASGHSARTDRNISQLEWQVANGIAELRSKFASGEDISETELILLRRSNQMFMRHFEDLHYQRQLGIIDDETWEASLEGIQMVANFPSLEQTINLERSGHRSSFLELVRSLRE